MKDIVNGLLTKQEAVRAFRKYMTKVDLICGLLNPAGLTGSLFWDLTHNIRKFESSFDLADPNAEGQYLVHIWSEGLFYRWEVDDGDW